MVEERKSPEEIQREIQQRAEPVPNGDDADPEPEPDASGDDAPETTNAANFDAIPETRRQVVNHLFDAIHGAGYMTAGRYNYESRPDSRDAVTLTVLVEDVPAELEVTDGGSE